MRRSLSLLTLALLACAPDPEPRTAAGAEKAAPVKLVAAPAPAMPPGAPHAAAMPDAEVAFARARALLAEHYVDDAITPDALYTGAIEGMLARLGPAAKYPVNELLSPRELDELVHRMDGTVVGIGVMLEQVADILLVRGVVDGGPAAVAGLRRGDRILEIDGVRAQGRPLSELADQLRGAAGTRVDLFIQRDTEEWHQPLVRAAVTARNVESKLLGDQLGYVRLRGMAEPTSAELDAALAALQAEGAKAVVLDLRACPGGMLEATIAVTASLLRDGQAIVTIHERGEPAKQAAAVGDGRWQALPLVALIGPDTASGCEVLAEALAVHKRATLIGAPTFGKGTSESVHELGNGWAIKFSTGRFVGAGGVSLAGVGVQPHVPVPAPEGARTEPLDAVTPESDPLLAVAKSWLEGQGR